MMTILIGTLGFQKRGEEFFFYIELTLFFTVSFVLKNCKTTYQKNVKISKFVFAARKN